MEQCHWLTGEPVLSALTHSTPPCPSECLRVGEEASKATAKSAVIKNKIYSKRGRNVKTLEPFEHDTAEKQRQRKSPLLLTFLSLLPSSPPFLGKPRTKYQQGSYLFNYLSRLWLIIRCDNGVRNAFHLPPLTDGPSVELKSKQLLPWSPSNRPVMDEYKRWMATINHHVCLGTIETWEE